MASGNAHKVIVVTEPGFRGYVAKCSCGKSSWRSNSYMRAYQAGQKHQAQARKGR